MLGALSAAALLASCSSDPAPLGDGGTPGQQCMGFQGFKPGTPLTTGIYDLDNTGTAAATIQSVTLPGAHRLRMTTAWLVPIGHNPGQTKGGMLVGAGWAYPPDFTKLVRYQWARRVPAVGATIKPGQDLNLVFGLYWSGGSAGVSGGPVIAYTAGGSSYTVSEKVTLEIAANC